MTYYPRIIRNTENSICNFLFQLFVHFITTWDVSRGDKSVARDRFVLSWLSRLIILAIAAHVTRKIPEERSSSLLIISQHLLEWSQWQCWCYDHDFTLHWPCLISPRLPCRLVITVSHLSHVRGHNDGHEPHSEHSEVNTDSHVCNVKHVTRAGKQKHHKNITNMKSEYFDHTSGYLRTP